MEEENSIKENLVGSKIKDWFISNSPSIIIALFSILSVSLLHYSGILNTYELKLLDMKYQQRGPLSGSDAISSWPNDESYIDIGNGVWDEGEDFIDIGNGVWDEGEEFDDMNGNGVWDQGEELWDDFGNGIWDEGEEFTDLGNGAYDLNDQLNQDGVGCWNEEVCGNGVWDDWESFTDLNGNDVWDEGEAWVETDQCQEKGDVCFQGACIDYKECHDINRNGVRDLGLDVVVVAGDDESFRLINEPYPYPRGRVYARALRNLAKAGAKVVVFDYVFDKPDHFTKNINLYKESNPESFSGAVVDGDEELLDAIKESRVGNGIWDEGEVFEDENNNGIWDQGEKFRDEGTVVIMSSQIKFEPTRFPPDYLLDPSETLTRDDVVYSHGLVNIGDDEDGFSRRYKLALGVSGDSTLYSTLAVKAVLSYMGYNEYFKPKINVVEKKAIIGPLEIDLYTANSFMVNFLGGGSASLNTFKMYPLSNILDTKEYNIGKLEHNPDYDPEFDIPSDSLISLEDSNWMDNIINPDPTLAALGFVVENPFKDKIVILGTSLPEDQDFKNIPFTNYNGNKYLFAGVEYHATAIQHLISNSSFSLPVGTLEFDSNQAFKQILLIAVIVLLIMLLVSKAEPFVGFAIAASALVLWSGFSFGAFVQDYMWIFKFIFNQLGAEISANIPNHKNSVLIPVIYPSLAVIFPFSINLTYKLFTEGQDKQFLKNTFGSYISAEMVDQMFESKEVPELGGKKGYHTLIFSDVASFSSFSEQLSESQLVELLNEYLTAMTDIILKNKGTVDKYIGDAIMAFYGAPVELEDHEFRAVFTVNEMNKKLTELKEKWRSEGDKWPDLVRNMEHRVGINTGDLVTGNMGSQLQMNYTCMGDTVNLAARLESGSKQWGVYTQVAKSVFDKTNDKFVFRKLSKIRVKGRKEPVITYELLCAIGDEPPNLMELIKKFELARKLYENQEWDKAIKAFSISDKLEDMSGNRHTNPSRRYIEICNEYKKNPPGDNWDGVYTQTQK